MNREEVEGTESSGLSRRTFLERLFTATVVGSLLPSTLRSVTPEVRVSGGAISGIYTLDLTTIPELAVVGGSVRLVVAEVGPTFRIIVTRTGEETFEAVNARCPHQGFRVRARREGEDFLECEAHKSHFEFDGTYITGPADGKNLTRYTTTFDGESTLLIEIDELAGVAARELSGASIALHSSGPNPGHLLFRVVLQDPAPLTLSIWTLDGREAARPHEGALEAGEHYLGADLSGLSSGLYIYRCHSEDRIIGVGKLTL